MSDVKLSFGVFHGEMLQPVHNAQFTLTKRPVLFLRLEVNGIVGFGECAALPQPLEGDASLDAVGEMLRTIAKERIARALRSRNGALFAPGMVSLLFGTDAISRSISAMVEMAFFDVLLKQEGRSLAEWLHVVPTSVEVGGFVAIASSTTEEQLNEQLEPMLAAGVNRFRLKIRPGFDATPVRWLRSAAPRATIGADANGSYRIDGDDVDGPPALLRLHEAGISHIEQPFSAQNLVDHATFRSFCPLRVCLDEGVSSLVAAKQIVKYGAADAFCVKPGRVGGIIPAVEILRLAEQEGIDCFIGGFFETGFARAQLVALAAHSAATLVSDVSSPATYGLAAGEHFDRGFTASVAVPQGVGVSGGNDRFIGDLAIDWEPLDLSL